MLFVIKKSDWKKNCILVENSEDFDPNTMIKIDVDEDEMKKITEMFKKNKKFISIKSNNTIRTIRKEDFDPRTMKINYEDGKIIAKKEFNIMDMIKSKKGPGFVSKLNDVQTGLTYKGKTDEGAIGNLLDQGLDGAKNRAHVRDKKLGAAFRRSSFNRTKYKKNKG